VVWKGYAKVLRSGPDSPAPSVWELLGAPRQNCEARVLTLSELSELSKAGRATRHRRTRGKPDVAPIGGRQPNASDLLAPRLIAEDADTGGLDNLIRRIRNNLSPDSSDEEVTEAASVAFWALTEEERQSLTVDELRRRFVCAL